MEEVITIDGREYERVSLQRDGKSAVYKGDGTYLRIGEPGRIRRDLKLHKDMESYGFPVARIIEEGEAEGLYYFVESSLGEVHLGKLFAEDTARDGAIREDHFSDFLKIVEQFGRAQIKTKKKERDVEGFSRGIHIDILVEELPQYRDAIESQFQEILRRLSPFPFVITQGDFNPNNLYPEGVIDLEDSFFGPFGYDLVSALVHINYFPDGENYEFFARYRFTEAQRRAYLATLDAIAAYSGLPALSPFEADFEFCRGVWSLVRMHKWPKIQKFRYDLFIEKFLHG